MIDLLKGMLEDGWQTKRLEDPKFFLNWAITYTINHLSYYPDIDIEAFLKRTSSDCLVSTDSTLYNVEYSAGFDELLRLIKATK